jgi:isocitrate lyase
MYPDQSLYPADIVPAVVRRINNTFIRADQIHHAEGKDGIDWFAPIVAEGYYRVINGIQQAISRGLAYALYADRIWCETGKPDLAFARQFAEAIHKQSPGKLLSYNCSPSFNWKKNLDDSIIAKFQRELGAMGYKFQFITLPGFHALNYGMFELARGYATENMTAYVKLQQAEFAAEANSYTATKHQREAGTGYFDEVTQAVQAGKSSVTALTDSTEEEQFI